MKLTRVWRAIVIGSVGAALLTIFLSAKHTEVAQTIQTAQPASTRVEASSAAEQAPTHASQPHGSPAPPQRVAPLSAAGLSSVMLHSLQGHSIAATPEYREFLDAVVANQGRALEVFKSAFDALPEDEIFRRTALFAVMLEAALAIKAQDPGNLTAFVREQLPLIRAQTDVAERVAVARQDLTAAQTRELLHIGGSYMLSDGQLYALTLQPKLMSVAVLKYAGTPEAAEYLRQIATDTSLDAIVQRTAALYASQLAGQPPSKF